MPHIELTNTSLVAFVDSEDFERINFRTWRLYEHRSGNVYAVSDVRHPDRIEKLLLHREVLRVYDARQVDHVSGDGLDNRRDNLRVATAQQNMANSQGWRRPTSSQYKGVSWDPDRGRWRAKIVFDRRTVNLGRFEHEEDAARAYDNRAIELFGEFARLNLLRDR